MAAMTAFAFITVDLAEAKRFGGGRSFGSRPSYNQPIKRDAPVTTQPRANQAQAGQPMGGMGAGGFLGGMLMGSFIGSLLMGGAHTGGVGILDFLVIAVILFFVFRYFRRRAASQAAEPGVPGQPVQAADATMKRNAAQQAWETLASSGPPKNHKVPYSVMNSEAAPSQDQPDSPYDLDRRNLPPDFNMDEFLKGARLLFGRLQAAWVAKDMNDISQFTTPALLEEIKKQDLEDDQIRHQDILMLEASLLDMQREDGQLIASVDYRALMREEKQQAEPHWVREVWHLTKDADNPDDSWRLDGIQQVLEH